jgi:hypothetical protein
MEPSRRLTLVGIDHEHHPRPHTYSELPESFALGSMNLRFPEE